MEHILALGAPEALGPLIGGSITPGTSWDELMKSGLRVLLFAEAAEYARAQFEGSLDGFALRPLALVGLSDEIRPEAQQVLEGLAAQGISFKILSGDNTDTVRATVEPLGRASHHPALRSLADGPVVSGSELAAAPELGELVQRRTVFGRVSPAQKVEVVSALKRLGRRVAMVGDGVNDVLPIKSANLGVAMGDGSRAAKTVAGLVLETNDFRLLPLTLDEGRTILRNLRRAAKLFLVKNVYMAILWVVSLTALGLPLPVIVPQQVTLLNTLTIGIPALIIMFGKGGGPAPGRHFLVEVGEFALRSGLVIGFAGLAVLLLAKHVWHVDDAKTQRTYLLTTLVLLGLDTLLRVLRADGEAATLDRRLRLWVAAAVPLYAVAMYVQVVVPILLTPAHVLWYVSAGANFFELTALDLRQWGQILAVVLPAGLLARASDRHAR